MDALLAADASRRAAIATADTLRAEQKTVSKSVGSASPEDRPALLENAKELAAGVEAAEARQAEAEAAFVTAHMAVPNIIIDGVPAGGEDDYVVLEVVGQTPVIDDPKDHLDLGESLGLIDMERGAKVSGSRFYFLTGQGALLQLGLLRLAVRLATENGFTLMIPPVLVRPEVMAGTGFLGSHADEIYRLEADDLYLVGTSRSRSRAITPARSSTCPVVRCATPDGRPASARGGQLRQGHPRRDPGAPVPTRWRPSFTASPRTPRPSISACWAGNGRCWN